MRALCNGKTSAFQADDTGSIPVARSTPFPVLHSILGMSRARPATVAFLTRWSRIVMKRQPRRSRNAPQKRAPEHLRARRTRSFPQGRRIARARALHAALSRIDGGGRAGARLHGGYLAHLAPRGATGGGQFRHRRDRIAGPVFSGGAHHRGAARRGDGAALCARDAAGRTGRGRHPARGLRPRHRNEPGFLRTDHDGRSPEPDHDGYDADPVGDRVIRFHRVAQSADLRRRAGVDDGDLAQAHGARAADRACGGGADPYAGPQAPGHQP